MAIKASRLGVSDTTGQPDAEPLNQADVESPTWAHRQDLDPGV